MSMAPRQSWKKDYATKKSQDLFDFDQFSEIKQKNKTKDLEHNYTNIYLILNEAEKTQGQ